MPKKIIIVVVLCANMFMFSGQSVANMLTVLTEHLAPFQIVKGNAVTGLSTEIVRKTLDESLYKYEILPYQWALSFRRSLHEKNTCIYSLARIPERETLFQWVGHIASSTVSLYSSSKRRISIPTLEDAKKYNIAVIRDDVTHHFLLTKGFVENQHFYVVDNYDALLKLLDIPSRNIDLVILNDDLLNNRVKNSNEASQYINVFQFEELTLNFYFACSLNTESAVVNKLSNIMIILEEKGEFKMIRNKWKKNMVSLIN